MRLECEEDMIEGVIRKVGDDLASVIGQDHGFVLCVAPTSGAGRMYCMTDLRREAVMNIMGWVRARMEAGDQPLPESSEALH